MSQKIIYRYKIQKSNGEIYTETSMFPIADTDPKFKNIRGVDTTVARQERFKIGDEVSFTHRDCDKILKPKKYNAEEIKSMEIKLSEGTVLAVDVKMWEDGNTSRFKTSYMYKIADPFGEIYKIEERRMITLEEARKREKEKKEKQLVHSHSQKEKVVE